MNFFIENIKLKKENLSVHVLNQGEFEEITIAP